MNKYIEDSLSLTLSFFLSLSLCVMLPFKWINILKEFFFSLLEDAVWEGGSALRFAAVHNLIKTAFGVVTATGLWAVGENCTWCLLPTGSFWLRIKLLNSITAFSLILGSGWLVAVSNKQVCANGWTTCSGLRSQSIRGVPERFWVMAPRWTFHPESVLRAAWTNWLHFCVSSRVRR